jgi:polar amino acid transport system permease protein
MSPFATFWRVIVPQVTPAAAPSIGNQFTVSVKSSTLVSAITVRDLMFRSQKIVNIWSEPIEILTAIAAIYIALIFPVSIAGKTLADSLRSRYGIAPA